MALIEIISPGMYSSIQDVGRPGMAFYAIPRSGALDGRALRRANMVVGNSPDAPAIEMNFVPATIDFHRDALIAISGAGMRFRLEGENVAMDTPMRVKRGERLSGGPSPEGGARAYLAIQGQVKQEAFYGSIASSENAGLGFNHGKPLKKGDLIDWDNTLNPVPLTTSKTTSPPIGLEPIFKVFRGPEFDFLDSGSQKKLFNTSFKIHPDSNRMAARLVGEDLLCKQTLKQSVPVLQGFIQCTPSGQLIILLNEAQTTGGYPRVAYLSEEEMSRFCQWPMMKAFAFVEGVRR